MLEKNVQFEDVIIPIVIDVIHHLFVLMLIVNFLKMVHVLLVLIYLNHILNRILFDDLLVSNHNHPKNINIIYKNVEMCFV